MALQKNDEFQALFDQTKVLSKQLTSLKEKFKEYAQARNYELIDGPPKTRTTQRKDKDKLPT